MAKQKTDNSAQENVDLGQIAESVEGNTEAEFDLDQFFGALENQVNGAVFDNPVEDNTDTGTEEGRKISDSEKEVDTELDTLKKRYQDSSREAKKLATKLKDYEQYDNLIPVLRVMREDPNLLKQVRDYLEVGSAPQAVVKQLDLPEDFVFDGDEAMKDPNSDSAKVFNATVDASVTRRMAVREEEKSRVSQVQSQEDQLIQEFQKEHKVSDDDLEDFLEWAKSEQLTLEHLWYLKNRDKRDQQILKGSFEERQKQLEKMKGTPASLASKNTDSKGKSEDDIVFDAILKAAGAGQIFGD